MKDEETPASRGGHARANALTPERRREIAQMGGQARTKDLSEVEKAALPMATHRGQLKISDDLILPCAVLSDGTRVITETAIARQLGRGLGGKTRRLATRDDDSLPLPVYLTASIEKHVPDSMRLALNEPIRYRDRGGVRRAVNAVLLPEICEVWLKARDADDLQSSQAPIAERAEALMRALSRVGVIALVDEATGYQEVRDRDELHKILAAYVNNTFLPWSKRFPDDFYQELFRLKGWTYSPPSVRRPHIVGKLTNELIYEQLPDGVLTKLQEVNPVIRTGYRRRKHHEYLTPDIGNPHLEKQVTAVTTLMRVSQTWSRFKRLFDRAFPAKTAQAKLPGMEDLGDEDE